MEKRLYAAYGSNMNIGQMRVRCPTAKVVGNSKLNGYELLFRGVHGSAVATVEPKKGASVPLVIWEIQERDEAALDHYESVPIFYRKETVKVKIDNKNIDVMIYIMNDGHALNLPSRHYYKGLCEGYKAAGFSIESLEAVLARVKEGELPEPGDKETDDKKDEPPAE